MTLTLGLTPQQHKALSFISTYMKEHGGISPSFAEIMTGIGLHSKAGVSRLLDALEDRGAILRKKYRTRSITVLRGERSIDEIWNHGWRIGWNEALTAVEPVLRHSHLSSPERLLLVRNLRKSDV